MPVEKFYAQIGKGELELDFFKKKLQQNLGYTRVNGSRQTIPIYIVTAQTMQIALHSAHFVKLWANSRNACESEG